MQSERYGSPTLPGGVAAAAKEMRKYIFVVGLPRGSWLHRVPRNTARHMPLTETGRRQGSRPGYAQSRSVQTSGKPLDHHAVPNLASFSIKRTFTAGLQLAFCGTPSHAPSRLRYHRRRVFRCLGPSTPCDEGLESCPNRCRTWPIYDRKESFVTTSCYHCRYHGYALTAWL
jgi:hypothetical protein